MGKKTKAYHHGSVEIGSPVWWKTTPLYKPRGVIDSCLRLFELGKIDREQTMTLIEYGLWQFGERPSAPWDQLKWD